MTKIAIISQPEQGVLVDIGGCDSLNEATQHLSSTFQVSNEFWQDQPVDLNLGKLRLSKDDLAQVLAILSERGVNTRVFFAEEESTRAALREHNLTPAAPPSDTEAEKAINGLGSWAEAAQAAIAAQKPATTAGASSQPFVAQSPSAQASAATQPSDASFAPSETEVAAKTVLVEAKSAESKDGEVGNGEVKDGETTTSAVKTFEAKNDATPGGEPKSGEAQVVAPNTTEAKQSEIKTDKPVLTPEQKPHVLYLRQTLRSGQSVSHKGHLVIIGDVNPGAEVSAEGDITVWGALRGIAAAGTAGNTNCEIRALKFDPIQLRIANSIARAPDRPRGALRSAGPETARIVNGTIRISSSAPE